MAELATPSTTGLSPARSVRLILGAQKIASILSISPKTVENYIHNIMLKIGCSSQEGIIDYIEQSQQYENLKIYYSCLKIQSIFEDILKRIHGEIPQEKESLFFYKGNVNHPLLQKIVKDLEISGIKVSIQTNEQIATGIPISIEDKKVIIAQKPYEYYFAIFKIIEIVFPKFDVSSYLAEFRRYIERKEKNPITNDVTNQASFLAFKGVSTGWILLTRIMDYEAKRSHKL